MDLEKVYYDTEGRKRNILQLVKEEPEWAANRIQEGEKYKKMWEDIINNLICIRNQIKEIE
jgi:hypothetical protein